VVGAFSTRGWNLPPKRNAVRVERDVPVPMRDGVSLLADHYLPMTDASCPTVLIRCSYGRGAMFAALLARPLAERGYHVLLQSVRGTFGSGGVFRPAEHEADDAHDTVVWLRTQDWFDGRLGTAGPSYLGFAQWALALDSPPELKAMSVSVGPHDLAESGYGQGVFELYNLLMWSDLMAGQARSGPLRAAIRAARTERRITPAARRLPLAATAQTISDAVPWFADWLAHRDLTDPFWDPYHATDALQRVQVPVRLFGGFHDFFLTQTLRQYQVLTDRGIQTALTIGPWNHLTVDFGQVSAQTLEWFDHYLAGDESAPRRWPVCVRATADEPWQELECWPPADVKPRTWHLLAGGILSDLPADTAGYTELTYNPEDPTPSVGGRLMAPSAGSRDNTALEARPDVVTFTSPVLDAPLRLAGSPVANLTISSGNPHLDVFVRLCDVDTEGRSYNITDQIQRLSAAEAGEAGEVRQVTLSLPDTAHTFAAGHRIRLQLSGGAFPRYARNLGQPEDMFATDTFTATTRRIHHDSTVILPVRTGG
jgi:putative CocE/NonD family hydrolase